MQRLHEGIGATAGIVAEVKVKGVSSKTRAYHTMLTTVHHIYCYTINLFNKADATAVCTSRLPRFAMLLSYCRRNDRVLCKENLEAYLGQHTGLVNNNAKGEKGIALAAVDATFQGTSIQRFNGGASGR